MNRDFGAVVDGECEVEGGGTGYVIYLVRLLRKSSPVKGGRNVQLPSLAGLIPIAPYIALATAVVVKMRGTPESRTALGKTAPELDLPILTGRDRPL